MSYSSWRHIAKIRLVIYHEWNSEFGFNRIGQTEFVLLNLKNIPNLRLA